MAEEHVKVGQIWEDWDSRVRANAQYRRRFVVHKMDDSHAFVTGLRGYEAVGPKRRIRLDRFKPNSTGYRLVTPC